MQHSYILAGIKANRFIGMTARNGGLSFKYLGRALFLLNAGLWSSVFSLTEKLKFGKKIKTFPQPQNPVIIVGNWRTGSTFLHQLLNLDPNLAAPTVYQVSNPDHLLVSEKYYRPLMQKVLGEKRPMDNVKIGPDEPQEDEYALLKLCKNTPLEQLIFKSKAKDFLNTENNFLPKDTNSFADALELFVKKIAMASGKRPLLKNPFHSLRISLLKEIFPKAKFIHIVRDPEKVIPSARHLWNIVRKQNSLKGQFESIPTKKLAEVYHKIITDIREEFKQMPENQSAEIHFEDLESRPLETIIRIYDTLQLAYTPDFEQRLNAFLSEISHYKKNSYRLSPEDKDMIRNTFSNILPSYFNNKEAENEQAQSAHKINS